MHALLIYKTSYLFVADNGCEIFVDLIVIFNCKYIFKNVIIIMILINKVRFDLKAQEEICLICLLISNSYECTYVHACMYMIIRVILQQFVSKVS
jgi:hypothetical protein